MASNTENGLCSNRGGVVYSGDLPDQPAPKSTKGAIAWMRDNLFNGAFNSVLTLSALLLVIYTLPSALGWLVFNANWVGGAEACRVNPDGACWPFVSSRWEQFLYGFYEKSERWRIDILLLILFAGIALMVWEKAPGRKYIALLMLFVYPVFSFFMMYGNEAMGLQIVETSQWGGFSLTLVIALSGIVASLPLGVVLALGRRSEMPVISLLSTIFIEFWRGIPLVAVLFMATIMFPLFLPAGVTFDQLLRAVIGVALFASAYMAEVVRGGEAHRVHRG